MTNRGDGNRNDRSNLNCGKEKESFREHRERMKAFRALIAVTKRLDTGKVTPLISTLTV